MSLTNITEKDKKQVVEAIHSIGFHLYGLNVQNSITYFLWPKQNKSMILMKVTNPQI